MDNYDKAQSVNNISTTTPPPAVAHVSGVPEYPQCKSDLYTQFMSAPTREIINAIEGMGLTRDGTDMTQLLQAILLSGISTVEHVTAFAAEAASSPRIDNVVTSFALSEISEISGSIKAYMQDGSGVPTTEWIDVNFSFLKGGGGSWTSVGSGNMASSTQGQVINFPATTGTTTLTGTAVYSRNFVYEIIISDNNIKFEVSNTAGLFARFGMTGIALIKG